MTAQLYTCLRATPVTTTLTSHGQRAGQLRARAVYMTTPGSHHSLDELRDTAAAVLQHRQQQAGTDALRAGVFLYEYGVQSTYYFHHLHQNTSHQSPAAAAALTSSRPLHHAWQAAS